MELCPAAISKFSMFEGTVDCAVCMGVTHSCSSKYPNSLSYSSTVNMSERRRSSRDLPEPGSLRRPSTPPPSTSQVRQNNF